MSEKAGVYDWYLIGRRFWPKRRRLLTLVDAVRTTWRLRKEPVRDGWSL